MLRPGQGLAVHGRVQGDPVWSSIREEGGCVLPFAFPTRCECLPLFYPMRAGKRRWWPHSLTDHKLRPRWPLRECLHACCEPRSNKPSQASRQIQMWSTVIACVPHFLWMYSQRLPFKQLPLNQRSFLTPCTLVLISNVLDKSVGCC